MKEFSVSSEELTSLNFNRTIIEMLRSSVGRLNKLVECDLSNVRLETLPNELCLLVSLEKLNLEGCKQLIELPHNMKALSRLQDLNITDCCSLESLPELPPSIIRLSATNCASLEKLFNAETVFSLNLMSISFENCERLDEHSFLEYVHHAMMGVAIREILADMLKHCLGPNDQRGKIFYPESKVPSWIKYQTRESAVTVDLVADQPHYVGTLVGFILCCVVYHIPSHRGLPPTGPARSAKWPPRFRCIFDLFDSTQFAETSRWSSDHVCIWFEEVPSHHSLRDKNVTFKFETESIMINYVEGRPRLDLLKCEWEVIGCGICPLYASDILDVFQNVDPGFHFFYDRFDLGWPKHFDQSVFTLDQVKTQIVQKMEDQQKVLPWRNSTHFYESLDEEENCHSPK